METTRYLFAGLLHIVLFAGFLVLSFRSISLVMIGISDHFVVPGLSGGIGDFYQCRQRLCRHSGFSLGRDRRHSTGCLPARALRGPVGIWEGHTAGSDLCSGPDCDPAGFRKSLRAPAQRPSRPARTGCGFASLIAGMGVQVCLAFHASGMAPESYLGAYLAHEVTFFCFPVLSADGKTFHGSRSLFNVYFAKLDRGTIKPSGGASA